MAGKQVMRKISVILIADAVGYSRLMAEDAMGTVRTLKAHQETISILINQYRGRVLDCSADKILSEFASVLDAVSCSLEIQQALRAKNAELSEYREMAFRVGINLADVIVEGERIYGLGVNLAAMICALADPGGICISETVHAQIVGDLPLGYKDLGPQTFKDTPTPVKVYRIPLDHRRSGSAPETRT